MQQTLGDALERFPHGIWLPQRLDGTSIPKLVDTDELLDVLGKLRNEGFPQAQLSAPIKWGEDGSLQLHFYPQGWKTFVRLVKHDIEEVGRGGGVFQNTPIPSRCKPWSFCLSGFGGS